MKSLFILLISLSSFSSFALETVKFQKLFYISDIEGSDRFNKVGDIMMCLAIDARLDRNLVSACFNYNALEDYKVSVNDEGHVVFESSAEKMIIGSVNFESKIFTNNDNGRLVLKTLTMNEDSKIILGSMLKTSLALADNFGCGGVFDCNYDIIQQVTDVYLFVEKRGRFMSYKLEKVKVSF